MKRLLFPALFVFIGWWLYPEVVPAQGGFVTRRFFVDVRANENRTFDVTETITVDFFKKRHGIFRDIPYIFGKVRIDSIEVEGEPFRLESENDNGQNIVRIRIGEEETTVYGLKTYRIKYTIAVLSDETPDYDFINLDLLPSYWKTSVDSVRCTLILPKTVDWTKASYFSGKSGSEELSGKFHIEAAGNRLLVTAAGVDEHEGFTVWCLLPEGYWQGMEDNSWVDILLILVLLLVPSCIFVLWFFKGRDPEVVPTVEIYPPDNMSPVDAGYMLSGKADSRDFLSLIIYFANKGYLSIKEFPKGDSYYIESCHGWICGRKTILSTFSTFFFPMMQRNSIRVKIPKPHFNLLRDFDICIWHKVI